MEGSAGSEFTRIELYRSRYLSTVFSVSRWVRRTGTVPNWSSLALVSDLEESLIRYQGGFGEAFVMAWRMSEPGETGLVQVHERDRRQEWRVVNSYPVQFPRRAWVRPAEWDRGRS